MYKALLTLMSVLGFIVYFGTPTHAEENLLKVNVYSTSDSIQLTWDNTAHSYKVYFEGQLVYEGSEVSFNKEGLESDYQTEFLVKALNTDGTLLDEVAVNASTLEESLERAVSMKFINPSALQTETDYNTRILEDSLINSIIGDKEVSLDWEDIPGVSSYEVFRDETKIADVDSSEYVDSDISPDTEYQYEIVGKKRFSQEAIAEIDQKIADYQLTLDTLPTAAEKEDLYNFRFSFIKDVKTLIPNSTSTMMSLASTSSSSSVDYKLRYTTFIPSVREPNPFDFNTYIKGDDRGFSSTGKTYRTRADMLIHFGKSNKSSKATLQKFVHPSKRYDIRTDKLVKSYKASTSGMKMSNKKVTKSSISFSMYHDIGTGYHPNLTPDITYSFKVTIYRNGKYKIKGTRDQAPSHEFYIQKKSGGGSFKRIFRAPNKGLRYLLPPMKNAAINYSN